MWRILTLDTLASGDLSLTHHVGEMERIALGIVNCVDCSDGGFPIFVRPQNPFCAVGILDAKLPNHYVISDFAINLEWLNSIPQNKYLRYWRNELKE